MGMMDRESFKKFMLGDFYENNDQATAEGKKVVAETSIKAHTVLIDMFKKELKDRGIEASFLDTDNEAN